MGNTPDAVPQRLQRHEVFDVLIMVGSALGKLVEDGKVVPDSRVDVAQSVIGVAVARRRSQAGHQLGRRTQAYPLERKVDRLFR